jgi:peptidoglycan hydrolase CwlO-like protein
MYSKLKILSLFIVFIFSLFIGASQKQLLADNPTPTPTGTITPTPDNSAQVNDLNNKIKDLEAKVSDLQSQEKTFSSQISVMDNQIKLTQYRIESTKEQITELTHDIESASERIAHLEGSLTNITKTLLNRISATYQLGSIQPLQLLISSQNFTDFIAKTNYIRIVQAHDKEMMYNTVQAKNDYSNQKNIFEDKKKEVLALQTQLQDYTTQLDAQKAEKQRLLNDTQGSEANYQRLLAQARAQLAGFSRFVQSQGGASLLGGQTVCDDWGCYYNQRDSQWGGNSLNGTHYTLASDGCLVTSMAMVYTHYGHRSVTPQSINSNPSNFASYEPAWLLKTIVADGTTATRISSSIDSELSNGRPVIVGISYDGGPLADHFVVLISGSGGNYQMNDPYTANGHNIPFTSHYTVGSIREIDRISI